MVLSMSVSATYDDEQDLIRRLQAGEQAAYAEMVERYAGRIYNLALRLMALLP